MAPDQDTNDRRRCTPCRGSGQVISTEGGETRSVPWHHGHGTLRDGTGTFIPGHDAQAARGAS